MMENINGNLLLKAIQAGGNRVIESRRQLNSINILPVADADTGNNLSALMRSINEIEGFEDNEKEKSIAYVLQTIAHKALEGSKGNSGMIFAQYFNGIARYYQSAQDDLALLVESLVNAVQDAYQAVQVPQEGTILTVMRIWSHKLKAAIEENSLLEALNKAKDEAKKALFNTKTQHDLLKQNNVVDAGAQGFYLFIEGLTETLINPKQIPNAKTETLKEDSNLSQPHTFSLNPTYKYCMEITMTLFDNQSISKDALEVLGDSIVIVKGQQQAKVHLHTSHPKKTIAVIEKYGVPLHIKVDDMQQQYYDHNINKQTIALATDSIADLPESIIEKYHIHILPLTILVDETGHLDKLTVDNSQIFDWMKTTNKDISSSLPSQGQLIRFFENLEQVYDHLLFVTVSSALSGTYHAITNAVKQYQGRLNIQVVDSKLNSIAQGLLVKTAAEYIAQGMDINDLTKQLQEDSGRIRIYVAVSDLKPMIQSGRIPQKLGRFLQKIKLQPVVTLDKHGAGKLISIGRNFKQNQTAIQRKIKRQKDEIEDILLGYTSEDSTAKLWKQQFHQQSLPTIDDVMTSAIIALSAGEKATAVAVKYKRRK